MKAPSGNDANNESTTPAFYAHNAIEDLAKQQGVKPVIDPGTLAGDFWPEDETAEEFIATLRQWRNEGTNEHNLENS
ncbi:MAG TPA: hypothetical protein VGE04_18705 [Chloroflexia bacterium]|jgi:hypothetical protein